MDTNTARKRKRNGGTGDNRDPSGSDEVVTTDATTTPASTTIDESGLVTLHLMHPSKSSSATATIPNSSSSKKFDQLYSRFWCVHIPQYQSRGENTTSNSNNDDDDSSNFSWRSIAGLFEQMNADDQRSWCIENAGTTTTSSTNNNPSQFLTVPSQDTGSSTAYYASFVLQKDTDLFQSTLKRIPVEHLTLLDDAHDWNYGPCLWFFFGINQRDRKENLSGRTEHTDSVQHDGTWHFQLSGVKRWHLRPTEELLQNQSEEERSINDLTKDTRLVIDCKEGDVLLLNTRLWWHRTEIPPQKTPSVSYARDFYLSQRTDGDDGNKKEKETSVGSDGNDSMTNVDGLYAASAIEAGTILFRETNMPDCELHRSKTNPNCEVVELEEKDGESTVMAVVSTRDIAAGEFFCIAESSSEDEEDELEDEELEQEIQCIPCPE